MKIELNHELDDIEQIIEEALITDDTSDINEVKESLRRFNTAFQAFEVGIFVGYVGIVKGEPITKMSEIIQEIINRDGYQVFTELLEMIEVPYLKEVELIRELAEDGNEDTID